MVTTIKIPSKIEKLTEIERLIDSISETVNISSDIYANILVGVTEAVKNAIIHGNDLDPQKNVTIEYEVSQKYIAFKITDLGEGFDYYSIPDPTLPENIEKEIGRGLFLMNCLSDEVVYNNAGNEVNLKFFIN
ncbi:MAG: ATP-binding protein [Bacteroidales bacterium]|nr:ATP-binding protein [Bacteroidales bacterium]HPY82726.1 ATP-binding protein [Bacteroidales bacterium]